MSSWNNGRTHFRERRIIQPAHVNGIPIYSTPTNKYFSAVCAIALNEEPYIDEWIKYNLLLGFQHIFIYDNSNDNNLKSKSSDHVTVIHFPGPTKQLEAYTLFSVAYKNKCKWAAFIDCDEFIVLKKHNNISELLLEYDACSGIVLNWKMFGTSHHVKYEDEPVLSRFKYCSSTMNIHYKSIVKLSLVHSFSNPHRALTFDNKLYDLDMRLIDDDFNREGNDNIACIHHYYTKSEEEFIKKINRGRADVSEKRTVTEVDDIHSKNNDVYNSDAWDFYSKHSH
jgi:hypothetical protein